MFYDKKYALSKPERKRLILSNFKGYDENKLSRSLPCDYVDNVYNFGFKNNSLVNLYGISSLRLDGNRLPALPPTDGYRKMFVAKRKSPSGASEATVVVAHSRGIEYISTSDEGWQHIDCDDTFTAAVNYIYEDEDLLLLSGNKGIKAFCNGELKDVPLKMRIKDMCVHSERIYAVSEDERNKLWFSDDFNPFNWNVSLQEGGYIEFDGSLGSVSAVRSFDNYLYVFCDYGIYRLSAYVDQSQFSLKKIYSSSGRIYSPSVTECGEYIAFAGEDGVYLFDGYDVGRFSVKTNELLSRGFEDVSACYAHHRYILSFTNGDGGDYGAISRRRNNNMILIFDLADRSVNVMRGVSFFNLTNLNTRDYGKVIGLSEDCDFLAELDKGGLYFDAPFLKYWESGEIDFDRPSEQKVLRAIEYNTEYQYILGVMAGEERYEFLLSPDEKRRNLYIRSDAFRFYIKSDNVRDVIKPPALVVDFLK